MDKKGIIPIFLLTTLFLSVSSLAWYDGSWEKMKTISLQYNGTNTTLSEYQTFINVTWDSDMNTDFSDLRFIINDTNTSIPYWVQNKVDSSYADIWIKVPSISNTGFTLVDMYYDNSGVTSESNGNNTFVFFDDFNGADLNSSIWCVVGLTGFTSEVGGGRWTITSSTSGGAFIHTCSLFYPNIKLIAKANHSSTVGGNSAFWLGFTNTSTMGSRNDVISFVFWDGTGSNMTAVITAGGGTQDWNAIPIDYSIEKIFKITWNSTTVQFYGDNILYTTSTSAQPTNAPIGYSGDGGGQDTHYAGFDYYAIAQFVDEEPYSTFGVENEQVIINESEITNCLTLSVSGDYYLINDILNSGFKTCINITTNNVNLNCQNYRIDGRDSSFPTNISYGIYAGGFSNVNITDCYISDWSVGVVSGSSSINDNITVTSNAMGFNAVGSGITLKNSDVTFNTYMAINLGSTISVIPVGCVDCNIFNNYFYGTPTFLRNNTGTNFYNNNLAYGGLLIGSPLANSFGGNIYDNNITFNGGWGIYFNNFNNSVGNFYNITNYTIYGNRIVVTTYGIMTTGSLTGGKVFDNKIYDNYINSTLSPVQDPLGYFLANDWNTTKTLSENIIGGSYIGGNYWGKRDLSGYSDTCAVTIENGFCDNGYSIGSGNIDYLSYSLNNSVCNSDFQLNSTQNNCYNETHYEINTTYYDFNECNEIYTSNYTYSDLPYSLFNNIGTCYNSTTLNTTHTYNDTQSCSYNIFNYTLTNCPYNCSANACNSPPTVPHGNLKDSIANGGLKNLMDSIAVPFIMLVLIGGVIFTIFKRNPFKLKK